MARTSRKRASSRIVSINFSGVEAGYFSPPEDDYKTRIEQVEETESSNKNSQLEFTMEIIEGKYKGKKFKLWFSLVTEALWKLSGFLASLGVEVPESELDLDLDELTGKSVGVVITHREYNGKTRHDVSDHYPLENNESEDSDEEDDEKPVEKTKSKKKEKSLPPISGDEITGMSEDELEEVVEKYGIEVDLSDFKTLRKKQNAICDALEEKDLLES